MHNGYCIPDLDKNSHPVRDTPSVSTSRTSSPSFFSRPRGPVSRGRLSPTTTRFVPSLYPLGPHVNVHLFVRRPFIGRDRVPRSLGTTVTGVLALSRGRTTVLDPSVVGPRVRRLCGPNGKDLINWCTLPQGLRPVVSG